MVFLDDLGLEVTVLVNNLPATEFPDDEPGTVGDGYEKAVPRSYKWILATDDAPFTIRVGARPGAVGDWLLNGVRHALRYDIDIDDKQSVARGTIIREGGFATITGAVTYSGEQMAIRDFQFASISTVDDASKLQIAEDTKRSEQLGLIRVRLYRVTYELLDRPPSSNTNDASLETKGSNSIAEKAIKGRAVSHGTVFSPAVYSTRPTQSLSCSCDPQQPIAIISFKYRSKEALQQELVIPRSRSVSVSPDIDQLPENEVRRLARAYLVQNRENKKRAASVKSEPHDVPLSKRPLKVLKTEGGRKVTIDLTEDD